MIERARFRQQWKLQREINFLRIKRDQALVMNELVVERLLELKNAVRQLQGL